MPWRGIPKPVIAAITGTRSVADSSLHSVRTCGSLGTTQSSDCRRFCSGSSLVPVEHSGCPRLIGPSRAKEMIFTGRFVNAEEALSIGLVDRVVAPDDVYDEALKLAQQLPLGNCAASGEERDQPRTRGRPADRA